jgi:putative ABC transport system ATP-binding protein
MADTCLLQVRDLCKIYDTGKVQVPALQDVNLDICAGDFVAIMGPSGSGKTTFMNIIGCLDRPTCGSYLLQAQRVDQLTDDDLADLRNRYLGFVFQSFNLLPQHTALMNVELPLIYAGTPGRKQLALEALEQVNMADRSDHRPAELSGGQQQRVAIARALVSKPSLILADEPTGALDSHTGQEILNLFDELNRQGITLVTVTHDRGVADRARRLVEFLDGRIVSDTIVNGEGIRTPEVSHES